jgi:hypothetical protein
MLKDKTQNLYVLNISEIDNKIDDNDGGDDDDDDMFICVYCAVYSI